MTFHVNRYVRFACCVLGLSAGACQTMTHDEARVRAEERWSNVRGRVKLQLAEQQFKGGLFEEAVDTLTEALALDPTPPQGYVMLAQAYLELGKPASAREVIKAARKENVDSAALSYTEGVILERQDDIEGALAKYTRARVHDPHVVDYLVAEAECLVALDRTVEAAALLEKHAGRLDDSSGTMDVLAAHISALLGDVDGAARRFRESSAPPEAVAVVADELATLLMQAKRYDEALSLLRPLIQKEGVTEIGGAVWRAVGTCHLNLGDPGAARQVMQRYLARHPDDGLAQLLLAKAAIAAGDSMTAGDALRAAERLEPNRPEVKLVRAVTQWQGGDLNRAAATLRDLLAVSPTDVDAHCLMGEVLQAQDDRDGARRSFEAALEIDSTSTWARSGLRSLG